MMGALACLSAAVLGIDYGWQPVAGGGIEYIIQIEPQMLERLKAGEDIFSDLPPQTGNIRGYRITVGTSPLPHQGQPLPSAGAAPAQAAARSPSDVMPIAPRDIEGPLPGPIFAPAIDKPTVGHHESPAKPPQLPKNEGAKALANEPASENIKASHEVRRPHADDSQTKKGRGGGPHSSRPTKSTAKSVPVQKPEDKSSQETATEPTRPGITMLGLFASLGGNAFLVWVAVSQRSRYRALTKLVIAPSALQNHQ